MATTLYLMHSYIHSSDAGVDDLNDKPKEESAAIFTQAFNAEHAGIMRILGHV